MNTGGVPVADIQKLAPANAPTTGPWSGRIILGEAMEKKLSIKKEQEIQFGIINVTQDYKQPELASIGPTLLDSVSGSTDALFRLLIKRKQYRLRL